MIEKDEKLDLLLWTLAEGGNEAAQDEFLQMHPALRDELQRRTMMVSGLRSAKPAPCACIPSFRYPGELGTVRPVMRRLVPILVGCGAVLIASASWVWWQRFSEIPESTKPAPPVRSATAPPGPTTQGMKGLMVPHREPGTTAPSLGVPPGTSEPAPRGADLLRSQRPISIRIERAKLASALHMIAAKAGIALQIGPGLPDFEVVARYDGMSAMEIFADMGRAYGFTAFDQDGSSIIIVPARDPAADPPTREEGIEPAAPRLPGR